MTDDVVNTSAVLNGWRPSLREKLQILSMSVCFFIVVIFSISDFVSYIDAARFDRSVGWSRRNSISSSSVRKFAVSLKSLAFELFSNSPFTLYHF